MDQEYSKRFYGFVVPAYDWLFGRSLDEGRRAAARYVCPAQKVLEVGVGTGLGLRHYPSGCHVVGVDICPQMLAKAHSRAAARRNGTRIDLQCMDATCLAFPDEAFDVVVAPYVLTTVGDPSRLCGEIRRVCRRGGRVIVVSNTREKGAWGALKSAFSPLMEKVGFATDLDVEGVMEATGLEVLEEHRVNLGIHKLFVARPA